MTLNGRKSSRKELEAALVMLKLEVLDLNARLGHALSQFDIDFDLSGSGEITNGDIKLFLAFLKKQAMKLPEEKQPVDSYRIHLTTSNQLA